MSKNPELPRRALGKGLSALLPARPTQPVATAAPAQAPAAQEPQQNGFVSLALDQLEPNTNQPRTIFQQDRLEELAQSIRANGIIQPLVVQRHGDKYRIVAGERRWRAAKLAGVEEVPAVVQDIASDRLLEVALVENIQREDLNAMEIARALDRLIQEFHLSHEEIGRRTGKDRTTITNLLRLLKLPNEVQQLVSEQRLSMGHARAIAGLTDPTEQIELGEKAAAQGMSVRQVERLIASRGIRKTANAIDPKEDPNVASARQDMERALGVRVRIVPSSIQRGRVEIDYYSVDDLDRIYKVICGGE
jgi:ParB family transcriptional regulator, chromosome partitioning protein